MHRYGREYVAFHYNLAYSLANNFTKIYLSVPFLMKFEFLCNILLAYVHGRMERVGNEEVRGRAGIERDLASRADQRVLRLFGHVKIMDDYRMARRVLMAEVSLGRVRGRPRLGWMGGVKVYPWATDE